MITVQKIMFLKNIPLFSGMPPEELGHLAGIAEEVIAQEGEVIIRQGEHGEEMYLIVEGKIEIHTDTESLAVLKEHDYFGEMSILDGEPRSATATARADCLLLRIRQSDFHDLLERHFNVSLTIIHTLTQRLREMNQGTVSSEGD